ncbi:hypothetical protein [Mycoplasmopsis californica]|nr:hypothetical protein [Mycoplasmopsis californica]
MNDNLAIIIKQLKVILIENKINWSISPFTYKQITSKNTHFRHFSICLYWENFMRLSRQYPDKFKYEMQALKERTLMPFFYFNKTKIFINLIIGTSQVNIVDKISSKTWNRLLNWGSGKRSFWLKLKALRSQCVLPRDLATIFASSKPTEYIVCDSSVNTFTIWPNLNWNNIKIVNYNGIEVPVFKEFDQPLKFLNSI